MNPEFVVLASGNGSNLQAVLDACRSGELPGRVVAVVTDRPGARAIERARAAGVAAVELAPVPGEDRRTYDARLAAAVIQHAPTWVVLAGWMRILSGAFLDRFPGQVINLHPALPGDLPGTRAIGRAHAEAMTGRRSRTGVMVHLVPDEAVDAGPVLASEPVPILPGDSLADLAERVHAVEQRLLVATLRSLCAAPGGVQAAVAVQARTSIAS